MESATKGLTWPSQALNQGKYCSLANLVTGNRKVEQESFSKGLRSPGVSRTTSRTTSVYVLQAWYQKVLSGKGEED